MMFNPDNEIPPVPNETARAARAVLGRKNFYILIGEQLEYLLKDFHQENPSERIQAAPINGVILYLILLFQFIESLTDEQVVDAVRTRIDWKFALHLPINTLNLRQKELCDFRQKIMKNPAHQLEFEKLADQLIGLEFPYRATLQSFETSDVLSSICSINMVSWTLDAIQAALGALASKYPEWLLHIAQPHWYWRFNRLPFLANPISYMCHQEVSMEKLLADIKHILEEVQCSNLHEINELKEIKTLYFIWERQLENQGNALSQQGKTSLQAICRSCIRGAT